MVRTIRPEDAEAIKRICEAELGHQTTAELVRQRIGELSCDGHCYIAVAEDEETHAVLGVIQAQKYDLLYGEVGWNAIALAVTRQAQGRGIGRQLLGSLEEHAKKQGDTFIRLNVNVTRTKAHGFYQHMGYCCDKTQNRFIKQVK